MMKRLFLLVLPVLIWCARRRVSAFDHPSRESTCGNRSRRANAAGGPAARRDAAWRATARRCACPGWRRFQRACGPAGRRAGQTGPGGPPRGGRHGERRKRPAVGARDRAEAGGGQRRRSGPRRPSRCNRPQHPRRAGHGSPARAGSAQPETWTSRKPRWTQRWRPSARTSPPRRRSSRRSCCRG